MSAKLILPAPAKLNLFLHITGQRSDGYHLLQTAFQLIDLCDELEFEESPELSLTSDFVAVPTDNNIVLTAARALQQRTGCQRGARIRLTKTIPAGGGLGGGSSDAATTLLALNRLWETGLSLEQLATLGLTLGADVPVFVMGCSAFAEGIGDVLTPLPLKPAYFVVIRPDCAVNTAAIFQHRELTRNTTVMKIAALPDDGGRNDCEAVVRKLYPPVADALAWLAQFGEARMSGTGSCIFAAFDTQSRASEIAAKVPGHWQAFVAQGLNRSPVHAHLAG